MGNELLRFQEPKGQDPHRMILSSFSRSDKEKELTLKFGAILKESSNLVIVFVKSLKGRDTLLVEKNA